MDLVALAKNPVPSGAATGFFKGHDRIKLRFARWEATRGPRRGTVCLFQGRGEFIEKYFEVVADLRRRGFSRGHHGLARPGRLGAAARQPAQGLRALVRRLRPGSRAVHEGGRAARLPAALCRAGPLDGRPHSPAQCHRLGLVVLAHGALGADDLHRARSSCGFPRRFPRLYAEIMGALALGSRYAPGGNDDALELAPFEGNPLTSDRDRYRAQRHGGGGRAPARASARRRSGGSGRR